MTDESVVKKVHICRKEICKKSRGSYCSSSLSRLHNIGLSVGERLTKVSVWYPWPQEEGHHGDHQAVARNGVAVWQAIELGDLVYLDTASEELTEEFLLFAIHSGLLSKWAMRFLSHVRSPRSAWR